MAAFDLFQFNNINTMLYFKLNNPPIHSYDKNTKSFYTVYCLDKYTKQSSRPKLYGPDSVVITYVYWHTEPVCKSKPIVVVDHEYDKDEMPCWDDAATYYTRSMDRDSF
jgi:hypothetical protein